MDLTKREAEIMELVSHGMTDEAVGLKIFLSSWTVKWHLKNVYERMGIEPAKGLNQRVLAVRIYLEHVHDQHQRVIRKHLEDKHMNGEG